YGATTSGNTANVGAQDIHDAARSGIGIRQSASSTSASKGSSGKSASEQIIEALGIPLEVVQLVGDVALELVYFAEVASDLSRLLRAGKSPGSYLADLRLDRNPLAHYMSKLGRNRLVKALSEILGGAEADILWFLFDAVGLYIDTYSPIADDIVR